MTTRADPATGYGSISWAATPQVRSSLRTEETHGPRDRKPGTLGMLWGKFTSCRKTQYTSPQDENSFEFILGTGLSEEIRSQSCVWYRHLPPSQEHTGATHRESEPWQGSAPSPDIHRRHGLTASPGREVCTGASGALPAEPGGNE